MIPPDEDPSAPDAAPAESPPRDEAPAAPAAETRPPAPADARPGASTFTIEGRSAPALFVVGWLATIGGFVAIAVALLAGDTAAARILLIGGLLSLSVGLVAGAGSQAVERRVRGAPYRGPSPFLVFAASIPISLLATIALGIGLSVAGVDVDGPPARLASLVLQALVYVGLIRLLVVDPGALSWSEMGVRRPDGRDLTEFGLGALWAFPVLVATAPLALIITQLLPVTPVSPLPPAGEAFGFVMNLLAAAVVAPVGEELLFRGLATTAWVRGMGERRAIVRGALFFAVVHVLTISGSSAGEAIGLAIVAFATRVPVALALGWLFVRRGTIWAPLGLHAGFNALLVTAAEIAARSGVVPTA